MKKSEIYVEITNEQERLKAIEILEKAGERTWDYSRSMEINIDCRYLVYCEDGDWLISPRKRTHQITLYQLEEMLMPKSEMKKQTAVEWLTEKLRIEFGFAFSNNILEQAKEMEREQIINAYETAMETDIYNEPLKIGKQYYNETFNP